MYMLQGLTKITRIPLWVALLLSAVVLCGWIPSFARTWQTVLPTFLLTIANTTLFFYTTTPLHNRQKEDGLPILFYVLSITAFPALHTCWQAQVGIACLLLVLHLLRHEQTEEFSPESAFIATLTLLLGSLFMPDFVSFIPILWLSMLFSRDFNVRTLSASLIAAGTFAIYLAIAHFFFFAETGYVGLFCRTTYYSLGVNAHALLPFWGVGIFFILILLFSLERNTLRWRMEVVFLSLFAVAAAVLSIFPITFPAPAYYTFRPLLPVTDATLHLSSCIPVSFALQNHLAVLYFRQYTSTARSVFFLICIAYFVTIYLFSWFA